MSAPTSATPVGQWVAEQPSAARVFEKFSIDYCCGGGVPLEEACAQRGIDVSAVLAELAAAAALPDAEPRVRWSDAGLAVLCDHIEQTHHAYLREELPRLERLLAKVIAAHSAGHPKLLAVREAFTALQNELVPHMFKEERILFPAIRRLEQACPQAFPFGSVAHPISVMEQEHDHSGDALAGIRRATGNYEPPSDACNTYRALLAGLKTLELDMHQHVHKENNILFPRAVKLERSRGGAELLSLSR